MEINTELVNAVSANLTQVTQEQAAETSAEEQANGTTNVTCFCPTFAEGQC